MPRVRADNDARYALRASFVDENGDVLEAPITISSTAEDPRITNTQITNWDSTYTTVNAGATNWDTAYGWGDHGAQGYYVNGSSGTTLGTNTLYHQNMIQCGVSSSGPVGFTINDGGGNANIVWNHFGNTANTAGYNTARIVHNTDSTSGSNLSFRVGDAGASPSEIFAVKADGINTAKWLRVSGSSGLYFSSHGGGWYMSDTTWIRCYGSKRLYISSTSSEAIAAAGDVVAYYSDGRLKDVSGPVEGALEKISRLHGVYYTHNEKARELGYTGSERQVGLIAQDVQAVLPEVIARAPIDIAEDGGSLSGEDYITVKYDRIVALLVEGIKELTSELDSVKLEIKELRGGGN